jgi:hypothetical protein
MFVGETFLVRETLFVNLNAPLRVAMCRETFGILMIQRGGEIQNDGNSRTYIANNKTRIDKIPATLCRSVAWA